MTEPAGGGGEGESITCSSCGGDGKSNSILNVDALSAALTTCLADISALLAKATDIFDKANDIKEKCNKIKEKCDDIWDKVK